ncbi:hypothetical protein [Sulfurisphaera tokodaii]|uniref:Uncharacterized protein n=2 Tax=Sulfurisphaera tokodaii TaxID=111955 RepID=Q972R2_SULTO|nr:hypothetical protein [Sulfurisphaera tokodaii]BAB66102.1 hypothetical protein STK_10720 [Sulfurisphaera tokodaii str. 7]HII75419.1 hypothetical protein [Sulfurisphaera tokodaii]
MRRGISVAIALIIALLLLIVFLIPVFILFNEKPIYSTQGQFQGSAYIQQQQYQNNQVYRGNPNIYYNSSTTPSLVFYFNSLPSLFNITQIYYYNGSIWVPVLHGNLVVSGNTKLPLPEKAFNDPIILVTSLGNVYFLDPNTSITTVTVSGPTGKIPIYITAFVINGSKTIPVSIQVIFGTNPPTLTPTLCYVNPGTYTISNKNGSTIFLSGYGLTATFQDWTIVGDGTLNSQSPQSVTLTAYGPVVITAVYKAQLTKFTVTIMPKGIPLGSKVQNNGATLTSLNLTIPVLIDNKLYNIPASGATLQLTYGYHIIQFPITYNITFNYTYSRTTIYAGEINTYQLTGLSTSSNNIQVVNKNEIFVNSSGTVYGNYQVSQVYYLVIVKNNFYLPNGVTLVSNTSPILGDLAGQLIQINNTYDWGPTSNYMPQKFYVPANSKFKVTYDYLSQSPIGTYKLLLQLPLLGISQTYVSLLSYPQCITVNYANGNTQTIYIGQNGYPNGNSYFTVSMPVTIINYEEWEYGGTTSPGGGL